MNHTKGQQHSDTLQELDIDELELVVGGAGYQLHRAFIKSWSTSGDADDRPTEEVAFYYNR